jgi:hypothetical protein
MKNKANLFLLFIASGISYICNKNRTKILKKISPKNIPSGSGIRDMGSGKIHPGSGSRG